MPNRLQFFSPISGAAFALAISLSPDVALAQTFQGSFGSHQLSQPFGSQAERPTATATFSFSDASLFHGNFVGSIEVSASPEAPVGDLDSTRRRIAAPIELRMTINFNSTLPQLAFGNTFQKFDTTMTAEISDEFSKCTGTPQIRQGLPFGTHNFSTSLTCSFPLPNFSVTETLGNDIVSGISIFRTLVNFVIDPEGGGFSKYSADVTTIYRWGRSSDFEKVEPGVVSNDPARAAEKFTVKITGRSFETGSTVSLGQGITIVSTRVNSATEIEVEINAPAGAAEGPRDVTVTKPGGAPQIGRGLFYVSSLAPAIEVNQGVPMECADDRPCIADHDSWVRVRLPCHGGACDQGKSASTGRLHVKKNGAAIAGSPFLPAPPTMAVKEAGTAFDPPALKAGADALNFRFTGEGTLAEGGYTFSFEIDPRNPSILPGGTVPDLRRNLIRELAAQPFVLSRVDRAIHVSAVVDQAPAARRLRPIEVFGLADFTRSAFPISKGFVSIAPSHYSDQYGPDLMGTLWRLDNLVVLEEVHNHPAQT